MSLKMVNLRKSLLRSWTKLAVARVTAVLEVKSVQQKAAQAKVLRKLIPARN